jgi:hypothetical protein
MAVLLLLLPINSIVDINQSINQDYMAYESMNRVVPGVQREQDMIIQGLVHL